MKKGSLIIFAFLSIIQIGFPQESLSDLLKKYNSRPVPYISVQELAMPKTEAIILDARERHEFEVSHLKNAIHVGYSEFDVASIQQILSDKNQKIVVYCSLGIRSEVIGEKLKKKGYTNVYNLFGGIFEWKNQDFLVYNNNEEETERVHVQNQIWSQWLKKGIKVYD